MKEGSRPSALELAAMEKERGRAWRKEHDFDPDDPQIQVFLRNEGVEGMTKEKLDKILADLRRAIDAADKAAAAAQAAEAEADRADALEAEARAAFKACNARNASVGQRRGVVMLSAEARSAEMALDFAVAVAKTARAAAREERSLSDKLNDDVVAAEIQAKLADKEYVEDAGKLVEVHGRQMKQVVLTTEYDVFGCDAFLEDKGRWLRLMPDADYIPP
jgi:hypothetical protein